MKTCKRGHSFDTKRCEECYRTRRIARANLMRVCTQGHTYAKQCLECQRARYHARREVA